MALQGKLKVEGRTYRVVECEYEFSKSINSDGLPASRPMGGVIKFVIPATSDDNLFFYQWMIHKTERHSGIFRFRVYTQNNKISYKTIAFYQAHCIALKDYFNDSKEQLMYSTITISAEAIRIGAANGVMLINEWRGVMHRVRDEFENLMNILGLQDLF